MLSSVTLQDLCAWVEDKWGPQQRKLVVQVWGSTKWEAQKASLERGGGAAPASADVTSEDTAADVSGGRSSEDGSGEHEKGGEEGRKGDEKGGKKGSVQRGKKEGAGRKGALKGDAKGGRIEEKVVVLDMERVAQFKRGLEQYPTLALPVPLT